MQNIYNLYLYWFYYKYVYNNNNKLYIITCLNPYSHPSVPDLRGEKFLWRRTSRNAAAVAHFIIGCHGPKPGSCRKSKFVPKFRKCFAQRATGTKSGPKRTTTTTAGTTGTPMATQQQWCSASGSGGVPCLPPTAPARSPQRTKWRWTALSGSTRNN